MRFLYAFESSNDLLLCSEEFLLQLSLVFLVGGTLHQRREHLANMHIAGAIDPLLGLVSPRQAFFSDVESDGHGIFTLEIHGRGGA